MSIVAFEGFDTYNDSATDAERGLMSRSDLWGNRMNNGDGVYTAVRARNGGQCMYFDSGTSTSGPTSFYTKTWDRSHIITGIAFNNEQFDYYAYSGGPRVLGIISQRDINNNTNGRIECRLWPDNSPPYTCRMEIYGRESADTGTAHTYHVPALARDVWHYIEIEYIEAPTNIGRVWVNSTLVADIPWTKDCTPCLAVGFSGSHSSETNRIWYDDMYILDGADSSDGAAFQSRLGPISIRPTVLKGDAQTEWDASAGGDRYKEVDENGAHDGDSSFITTPTANLVQHFKTTALDVSNTILAVTVLAAAKQNPVGLQSSNFIFEAKEGANQDDVPNVSPLQPAYRQFSADYPTAPDGSGFTKEDVESIDWGVRSVGEGT